MYKISYNVFFSEKTGRTMEEEKVLLLLILRLLEMPLRFYLCCILKVEHLNNVMFYGVDTFT